MSNYFRNFPVVDYRFGNNELPVKFQHLGTYVDILDQVKQYSVYYETYTIENGERPDALSFKLYETPNYYWTFYLLNHNLRDHGWPLRDAEVWPLAQKYYPNTCFTTTGVIREKTLKLIDTGNEVLIEWVPQDTQVPLCKSKVFKVGNWVYFKFSKAVGKILRIDQELGMLHLKMEGEYRKLDNIIEAIPEREALKVIEDPEYLPNERPEEMELVQHYDQFDAPHHYEGADGEWVYPTFSETYPNPINQKSVGTMNSVSYYQRLRDLNEDNKTISVIKPDSIETIVSEFNKLLKQ